MEDDTKTKIKTFVENSDEDLDALKSRWPRTQSINRETIRLIGCGVLLNPKAYNTYKKWKAYNLEKYGIPNFYDFWLDTILENHANIDNEEDAIRLIHATLQKRLRSKSKKFGGIIIAAGRKRDNFSTFIDIVLNMYKADPQATIKSGYAEVFENIEELRKKYPELENKLTDKYFIDNSIVVPIGKADINIEFDDGKFERKNWYNGRYDKKPVVGSAFMRGLSLFAKYKGSNYQRYELTLNDELCNITVPICKRIEFLANISPSDKYRLNPGSNIEFKLVDDGYFDISEVDKPLQNILLEFNKLYDYVSNMTDTQRWTTKAVWCKVQELPPTEGNKYVVLTDTKDYSLDDMANLFDDDGEFKDSSIHCPIPDDVDINFGEGSKILVFGTPRYGSSFVDGSWEEDKNKVSMWVSGIYVPKDEQVEISHTVDVSEQELDETFDDTLSDVEDKDLDELNSFDNI